MKVSSSCGGYLMFFNNPMHLKWTSLLSFTLEKAPSKCPPFRSSSARDKIWWITLYLIHVAVARCQRVLTYFGYCKTEKKTREEQVENSGKMRFQDSWLSWFLFMYIIHMTTEWIYIVSLFTRDVFLLVVNYKYITPSLTDIKAVSPLISNLHGFIAKLAEIDISRNIDSWEWCHPWKLRPKLHHVTTNSMPICSEQIKGKGKTPFLVSMGLCVENISHASNYL